MSSETIIDIGDFTVENMISFFSRYEESNEKKVCFDFGSCNKARLLPALVFSSWMKEVKKERRVSNIDNTHGGVYLKNIGFFKDLNVNKYKEQTINFDTSKKHIPIHTFTKSSYIEMDIFNDINKNITNKMRLISTQIFNYVNISNTDIRKESIEAMTFILREIIRNVFEHSKSNQHKIAMQIQEANSRIEIAILDEGIGIASSYSSNPLFYNYIQNPDVALKRAILPGSSRMFDNSIETAKKETTWENSGFGLFMSSRLCSRMNGSFNLISSGYHITLSFDKITNEYKIETNKNPFKGCAIGLEFDLAELSNYKEINKLILQEVKEEQKGRKYLYPDPSPHSKGT